MAGAQRSVQLVGTSADLVARVCAALPGRRVDAAFAADFGALACDAWLVDCRAPAGLEVVCEGARQGRGGAVLALVGEGGAAAALDAGAAEALSDAELTPAVLGRCVSLVAARRASEAALARSNAHLRAAVDGATDMLFLKDAEGRYLVVNRAFGERVGRTPEAIVGHTSEDLFPPETAALFAVVNEQLQRGEQGTSEYDFAGRRFVANKVALRDAEGRFAGIVGVSRDVTAMRHAEQRVGRMNALLRTSLQVDQMCVRARTQDELLAGVCRLLGDAGGMPLSTLALLVDGALVPAGAHGLPLSLAAATLGAGLNPGTTVASALASKEPRFATFAIGDPRVEPWSAHAGVPLRAVAAVPLRVGDAVLGVLVVASPDENAFADECGALLRQLAADVAFAMRGFDDALERRRVDARLRSSEERFRRLVEGSSEMITVFTPEDDIVYRSPAVERVLGWPADRLDSKMPWRLVHPEDSVRLGEFRDRVLSGGTPETVEFRLRQPDGGYRALEMAASTFDDGGVRLVLGSTRDITARKLLEARLMLSDRMASVGTLAAGVAHEINNPLAYVTTNLELVQETLAKLERDGALDAAVLADLKESIADAREGAGRVRTIVRDLRSFSRTDDDKLGPLDVRAVLDSTLQLLANELRHRARLTRSYAEVPKVVASEARLGQVFLNLLVNAVQSIPDGHALDNEVRVSVRAEGGRVIAEVSDTGVGISQAHLTRIFDPFFTTKPIGGGTGLGLFISHNIVAALGGELSVESAVGAGSTFRVVLPAAGDELHPSASAPRATTAAARPRVLVVDDEPSVGAAIRRILAAECDVDLEGGGRQALERLAAGPEYDAILCDVRMPDVTGLEMWKALGARATGAEQRLVFMTGGAFTAPAPELPGRAPNVVLDKPFTAESLRTAVREAAARRGR